MSKYLRALIVILFIAIVVFAFVSCIVRAAIGTVDFVRRRNLWLALMILAFLPQSSWLYVAVAMLLIVFTVSSTAFIPQKYWAFAGMGVACVQKVRWQAHAAMRIA